MQSYRIGIDLGTNALCWCLLKLDGNREPCGILDAGVRILSANQEAGRDPQTGASLAVDRRDAHSARRRRDRFLLRRKDLMASLVAHGLMPEDKTERKALEKLDPYELRARGLDKK
ncbi:MAG: type II CRISPR RNA-guided endonuclease Cas9, partial [Proteobacteria bacterium]|nr:type II CRISPR RNA-guided endonuclease Cas9 [Pseudomonadota bacterium]